MDSWAESDWMERFRTLTAGRTALLITHRFSTVMRADIIHVMDEGKINESGSPEKLLKQDGHYADSWKKQTVTRFLTWSIHSAAAKAVALWISER